MECVFCGNKDINKRIIVENELALAFPTNIPVVPGHTLIIPKRHIAKFEDLSDKEISAIFVLRSRLAGAFKKVFNAEGFNYAWNEGELAGQSISHFHLHILPRSAGDSGVTEYDPRKFLYRPGSREVSPESELHSVAARIKEALS